MTNKLTMTVKELRDELSKYPEDTKVFATWEYVVSPISPYNFDLLDGELIIDVEDY